MYCINQGDPSLGASIHQIRKLAASLSFSAPVFDDLKDYTGWKSPRVLYRHYFSSVERLSMPVMAAGKTVYPGKRGARGGRGRR